MIRERKKEYGDEYLKLHRNEGVGIWSSYPNLEKHYENFKKHLGYDNLFFTEGVSGGIKNILEVLKPSYISYDSDFSLYSIFDELYSGGEGPSIQFITNPKTNINYEYDYIVIDDVFQHYHNYSWDHLLPNVTILKSFSKAYGLAGLRVGYMTGILTEHVEKYRGGYEGNEYSLNVAYDYMTNQSQKLKQSMDEFKKALNFLLKYDFYHYDGYTNYVICDYDFSEKLMQHKIIVKKIGSKMRITVTNMNQMKIVNDYILKWMNEFR